MAYQGQEAKPNHCHKAFPAVPTDLGEFFKFLRSPKYLEVKPLLLTWKDCHEPFEKQQKIPSHFSKGLLLASRSSFIPQALWRHPEPIQVSFNHDITDKDLINKTTIGNGLYVSCYKEIRFLLVLCKQTYCHGKNNTHSLRVSTF